MNTTEIKSRQMIIKRLISNIVKCELYSLEGSEGYWERLNERFPEEVARATLILKRVRARTGSEWYCGPGMHMVRYSEFSATQQEKIRENTIPVCRACQFQYKTIGTLPLSATSEVDEADAILAHFDFLMGADVIDEPTSASELPTSMLLAEVPHQERQQQGEAILRLLLRTLIHRLEYLAQSGVTTFPLITMVKTLSFLLEERYDEALTLLLNQFQEQRFFLVLVDDAAKEEHTSLIFAQAENMNGAKQAARDLYFSYPHVNQCGLRTIEFRAFALSLTASPVSFIARV